MSKLWRELWYSRTSPGLPGVAVILYAWAELLNWAARATICFLAPQVFFFPSASSTWSDLKSVAIGAGVLLIASIRIVTPHAKWREKALMLTALSSSVLLSVHTMAATVQLRCVHFTAFSAVFAAIIFLNRKSKANQRLKEYAWIAVGVVLGFAALVLSRLGSVFVKRSSKRQDVD